MNKFCKVFAIVLAVLMLGTMATACKKSDDGDGLGMVGSSFTGGYTTDESGNVLDAEGNVVEDVIVDDQGNLVDKDTGAIVSKPDDGSSSSTEPPKTQEEAVKNYDSTKKWDAQNNPLVAETKKPNTGVKPSFDIDTTGFVKNGIKIADLNKKSLTLITSIKYSTFNYRGEKGEYVTEWDWFDQLKSTYGLKLTYIKSRFDKSVQQSLTYMNAGKTLDVIPTHVGGFPKFLNLSQPLDPYINLQNIDNSPGVNTMTLKETKWGGTYRCISPIGSVNVLWYNQSLVEQFGLTDPHTLFEQGKWNWDTFKQFVVSVPATTPDGKTLHAYNQCTSDMMYSWPLTNGLAPIQIDTDAKEPALINNWTNERTVAAWDFISSTVKSVKFGGSISKMYEDGTTMMTDAVNLQNQWDNYEYTKGRKYNWVPFPAATTDTGRCIAFDYGYTHMIPRKVKNQSNIPYAVKFMELWATRFCEAMFDYLATTKCYSFDYEDRKEYFEFVIKNTYFGVQMNEWDMLSGDSGKAKNDWFKSLTNQSYNIRTETEKVKNVVQEAIDLCLAYGK